MAIKIPSSKIYEMQNPKVRDNVIERIEVGSKEIFTKNRTDEVVYTTTISGFKKDDGSSEVMPKQKYYATTANGKILSAGYLELTKEETRYTKGKIVIPRLLKNSYISNILQKEGSKKEQNFQYVLKGEIITKDCKATVTAYSEENYNKSETIYSNEKTESTTIEFPKMPISLSTNFLGLKMEGELSNNTNVNLSFSQDNDNFYLEYSMLWYYLTEYVKGTTSILLDSDPSKINATGEYKEYIVEQIEITAYGNTIGIDLSDKTIYVPETNKTSKKVHSIDGNELMQTSNYYSTDNGKTKYNSINRNYLLTKIEYQKGKETATIRCSIADYYDYNTNEVAISDKFVNVPYTHNKTTLVFTTENIYLTKEYTTDVVVNYILDGNKGQLIIPSGSTIGAFTHTKNLSFEIVSVGWFKMAFVEYDKVIPMVYGADGVDRPMSLKLDGSPKIFTVLGTKIFYDGAIFQEISLQEA